MKKKCSDIILLTKHFPFNHGETPGETFLESEIHVLAEAADRVIVFACDVRHKAYVTCQLPQNVYPIAIQTRSNRYIKSVSMIRGACLAPYSSSEFDNENFEVGISKFFYLNYFIERGRQKYRKILHEMKIRAFTFTKRSVLIYSYWFYDFAYTAVLLREYLMPECAHIKCFSRAHRYDLYEYMHWTNYIPLREYLLRSLDYVFPCSVDGATYLRTKYPEFSDKIIVSYVGTPDYGICPWKSDTSFCIVSCSRLVPVKRVERIPNGLSLLENSGISIEWTHIGGGSSLDEIQHKCNEKLQKISIKLMGNIPNRNVLDYYKKTPIDVFLNVSENEGIPASIMEAISFGIPVIATDVGGTAEIVQDGINGYLLRKDFTDEELAETILRMANMPAEKYQVMRTNARVIWEQNFQFKRNTEELLQKVYEELSNGKTSKNETQNVSKVVKNP